MTVSGAFRVDELSTYLQRFLDDAPSGDWVSQDPVRFPRRFAELIDREVVAVFAALLAYGRVGLIGSAIEDTISRIGTQPGASCITDSPADAIERFRGFKYRLTRGEDMARVWLGLGSMLQHWGTIGKFLKDSDDHRQTDFRVLMSKFRRQVREATHDFQEQRSFAHFLPDAAKGSAMKRMNMLFRWMVRGPDQVDMGHWADLGTHRLTLPLDTHTHRIAWNLGLTRRRSADWRTANEITQRLREIDEHDPVRFDFALAHLGISGSCPNQRVDEICLNCPLASVCTLGTVAC